MSPYPHLRFCSWGQLPPDDRWAPHPHGITADQGHALSLRELEARHNGRDHGGAEAARIPQVPRRRAMSHHRTIRADDEPEKHRLIRPVRRDLWKVAVHRVLNEPTTDPAILVPDSDAERCWALPRSRRAGCLTCTNDKQCRCRYENHRLE